MKVESTIFREYDIRGVADQQFNSEMVYFLGRAYAAFARDRLGKQSLKVAVGNDCRLTGPKYVEALVAGLTSAEVEVIKLGLVTTPMTYFSIFSGELDGAIMVTGSHNPPEYNGFKICVGKDTLHGADIQDLKRLIEADDSDVQPVKNGWVYDREIFPAYLDFIKEDIKLERPLRIVVDAGNGAAGPFAPEVFRSLGCEVHELYCNPDGTFPNHEADPTVEANLAEIREAVVEGNCDAGIAFDGDGDRIGVVGEKGQILWGDELMVILSRSVLKEHPGATIISEVKSSNRLYDDINKRGGNGIMWKTGHSLIKAKIKETDAKLAGEMSGHIFFADRFFGFDDATYAGARFLEILAAQNGAVSDLVQDLPPAVSTPEIRVECDDSEKWEVIKRFAGLVPNDLEIIDIDGVRISFPDGWALMRASNTQPVIVMRFEAQSEARLAEIRKMVESLARDAGLKL